jgi:hypothetical protein
MDVCFWWASVKGGDLATWVGALSTFAATAVALWLGLRESCRRKVENQTQARVLASMLILELEEAHEAANRALTIDNCYPGKNGKWLQDMIRLCGKIRLDDSVANGFRLGVLPKDLAENIASAVAMFKAVHRAIESMRQDEQIPIALTDRQTAAFSTALGYLMDFLAKVIGPCQELAYSHRVTPWSPKFLGDLYGADLKK